MPALTPVVAAELEKRLRESRADLVRHIRARLGGPEDPGAVSVLAHLGQADDLSQADTIGDNEMAQLDQEQALMRAIDAQLARLDEGIANVCAVCGNDIPDARLLAAPTVKTCIACQQAIEKETRMPPGPKM